MQIHNNLNPLTGQPYTLADVSVLHAYEVHRQAEGVRLLPDYSAKLHITPRYLKIDFQGHLVKCSLKGGVTRPPPEKRGQITGFSVASRNRLLEKFARFKRPAHSTFLTLTYGARFPNPQDAKADLRALLERLRRRQGCEQSSGVWKIELQKRGAPHFHIIFFDLPFIAKKEIKKMWGEITGRRWRKARKDFAKVTAVRRVRKLKAVAALKKYPFTRIEAIRSWNGIMNYCSKYLAKVTPTPVLGENDGFIYLSYLHGMGRVWGIWNKNNLPFAELKQVIFPFLSRPFTKFRRIACLIYPPLLMQEAPGFKLFVHSAADFIPLWDDCANLPF